MINQDERTIRDTVHGYIYIPKQIFENIIDTPVFQRLRRIEQTSMRSLYPCARHDRFTHSIGVYHLGKLAVKNLMKNIKNSDDYNSNFEQDKDFWRKYSLLFELACLLHDCAHSPYSHSLENAYFETDELKNTIKERLIKGSESDATFAKELNDLFELKPSPHECVSAIMVGEYFKEKIQECLKLFENSNITEKDMTEYIVFIQRAIIGCHYNLDDFKDKDIDTSSEYRTLNFKNCLIDLLNSKTFDVDKLDYIARDSYFSGIENIKVDIERLLGALTIVETHEFEFSNKVNGVIKNSFSLNSCDITINGLDNELNVELKGGVKLEGKATGVIEGYHNEYNSLFISQKDKAGGNFTRVLNNQNIDATITWGSFHGSFEGKIKLLSNGNEFCIDGELNGTMEGKISGNIIGITKDFTKGDTHYHVGYKRNAVNILSDTINAKNRLYLWIYAHQKVVYADYVLRHALLLSLAQKAIKDDECESNKAIDKYSFLEKIELGKQTLSRLIHIDSLIKKDSEYYLIDDGDITYVIKNYGIKYLLCTNCYLNEWLSRKLKQTIWKSSAEYNILFSSLQPHEKSYLWELLFDKDSKRDQKNNFNEGNTLSYENSILIDFIGTHEELKDVEFVWIKPYGTKPAELNVDNTFVLVNESVKRMKDVLHKKGIAEQHTNEDFFYLYCSKKLDKNCKNQLIQFFKNKSRR